MAEDCISNIITAADCAHAIERLLFDAMSISATCTSYEEPTCSDSMTCAGLLEVQIRVSIDFAFSLPGPYTSLHNESLVQAALTFLARRHESLRTHFVERDGQVLQAVYPAEDPASLPQLQRRRVEAAGDELSTVIADLSDKPYELVGAGVPMRMCLIDIAGSDNFALFIGMHHILRHVFCPYPCILFAVRHGRAHLPK